MESFGETVKNGVSHFFQNGTEALLGFAGKLVIAFIVWFVCYHLIKWFCKKILPTILKKSRLTHEVHHFIEVTVKILLYVVLFIGIINILGFQTTSLVAIVGGAAVAIGASLQGSLSNFAGGLLLLTFKPFKKGDYIVVGSNEGQVENVGILYTSLRTLDKKGIMLPNGSLANSDITNYNTEKIRRLDIDFTVSYDQNVKEVRDVIKNAMMQNTYVIQDKGFATVVKKLTENGILVSNRAWIKSEDYWPAYFKMQELVINAVEEYGIDIANSQIDLHIKSDARESLKKT